MPVAAVTARLASLIRACGRIVAQRTWSHDPLPSVPFRLTELQDVLRLAEQWPAGTTGNEVRRAACELTEASSIADRNASHRRLLNAISEAEWRRAHGRFRDDDPQAATLTALSARLRG
jgi:hypothetical protein